MPSRTVRVRRLPDGHFEFLEPVRLPAAEFEVIVSEAEDERPVAALGRQLAFGAWDLGVIEPLTRATLYDDLI